MKWTGDRNAHINFEEKQKMDKIEELTSKNPDQTEGFKDRRPEWAAHDYIYIVNTSAIKTSRPIQFKTEVNKSKLSNTFYVLLLIIFIYITKIQSGDLTIYSRNFLRYCPDYTFLGQNSRTRLLPDFQFLQKAWQWFTFIMDNFQTRTVNRMKKNIYLHNIFLIRTNDFIFIKKQFFFTWVKKRTSWSVPNSKYRIFQYMHRHRDTILYNLSSQPTWGLKG